jgi:hypothetical protein
MACINGYKFETKQIADEAIVYLNTHHGLPVKGGVTKFDSGSYFKHDDGFFYIPYDAEWTSCLGEPIEIELPPINNIE